MLRRLAIGAGLLLLLQGQAWGFGNVVGACGGVCTDCHSLSSGEAQTLLRRLNPEVRVIQVGLSNVSGLWEVAFEFRGRKGIAYINFGKNYLIDGKIIEIATRKDITARRLSYLSRVDVSKISLQDALPMGRADAPLRVIIYDDPD
jgi:thiol:disulfide interchange protein DsbC